MTESTEIPESCDCVWTVGTLEDGRRHGSILIASDHCLRVLMHPTTFTDPLPSATTDRAPT